MALRTMDDRHGLPLDLLLERTRALEDRLLRRFRRVWVGRHVAVAVASAAIVWTGLTQGSPFLGALAILPIGILAIAVWWGVVAVAALAVPYAIVQALRGALAGDLARFERLHQSGATGSGRAVR